MNQEKILTHLLELAEQVGLEVREEQGDFNGGWCKLDDENYIFLNKKHNPAKKVSILLEALAKRPMEGKFVLPVIRDLLEQQRNSEMDLDTDRKEIGS